MLSWGTKSLFGLGIAAFVASLVYGVATDEGSGTTALAFVAAGAIALGLTVAGVGPDRPPVPAVEGPLPHVTPAGTRSPWPSIFPLGAAIAVAVLAIGAASSLWVVVPAAAVLGLLAIGWTFQVWTEHPVFTIRFGHRLSDRLVVPLGLPLAVFALVLVITFSLSRVLLAVPENGSRGIALGVAVVILAGAFFVASQERMARAALSLLVAFALLALVGAGIAGWAHGLRKQEVKAGASTAAPVPISTVDSNLAFAVSSLSFPAEQTVPLMFDNASTGLPHNIGIYDAKGGKELFRGDIVTGPKTVTYLVGPLAAGTYYFQCDVHPAMNGTLVVGGAGKATSSATTAPAGSTGATPTSVVVQTGLATTPGTAGP